MKPDHLAICKVRRPALAEPSARNRKSKMSKRKRDYKQEYARRTALGAQRGLSRSAARGHPRAGERRQTATGRSFDPNSREELALKMMRRGKSSLREAAARYGIGQERLRAYLKENTEARRAGGRWIIFDPRVRERFPVYSNGSVVTPLMSDEQASEAGRYMQAVKLFLRSPDDSDLRTRFASKGVRDINGKFYPFELDENTLYELDHRDEAVIPELYRISERRAS
jgi:hypothetical protein